MDRIALPLPALLIAVICLIPLVGVGAAAAMGSFETVAGLWDTVLLGYALNTLGLVLLVGAMTGVIGCATAWLVVTTEFRGRRWLEIALVIPLAFPAYVLAYAYTDILDHPGIVQTSLRALTGWGPRDYWFPEVRSLGGAAVMLTLVLYPYVYLLARAAFRLQAADPFFAARSLGASSMAAFFTVALPVARPAIAAGVLLVVMETIADFGTVAHFGVRTFATGIYTSWFSMADRGAAAQLALVLLAFALIVAALEQANRGKASYDARGRRQPFARIALSGRRAVAAQAICVAPVLFGVLIPTATLIAMATSSEQDIFSSRYQAFIQNSLLLGAV
ncbi:MAG: ABC transporter permease subunit, partial [Pseudomonadota bacterium]